jgi:manganese/iron transport system substrate-binding protein
VSLRRPFCAPPSLARALLSSLLLLGLALTAACGGDESNDAAGDERIGVAVSQPVLADIVASVAGERARVWSVIPPGADQHTYEPTPREITEAASADLFLYMGANLEDYLRSNAWRRALRDAEVPVVEFAQHLELIVVERIVEHGDHVDDFTGGDPHVWLDPLRTVDLVDVIVQSLVAIDPEGEQAYRTNADAFIAELHALHEEYLAVIERVPPERRKLIVFHDAYTYFEDRYGFEVVGIVMPNPQAEPSARDLAELHAVVESEGVSVVFREPQYRAPILDQLARDRGIAVGVLMTDTFTDDVRTYPDLMRFNLRSIETYLAE